MKVQRITVSNFKAIAEQTADFNGCSCIVVAGNNKGKTTMLRGIFDRLRGNKPAEPLKQGEKEGFAEAALTTGEKLRWEFKEGGKEKLIYITDKEVKAPLTQALRDKITPPVFDVDAFLQSAPMKQRKTLQDLAGLDFADIDKRYKEAYDNRTGANRAYNDAKARLDCIVAPAKVEPVSLVELQQRKEAERTRLNKLYQENKQANTEARNKWHEECEKLRDEVAKFNWQQIENRKTYNKAYDAANILKLLSFQSKGLDEFLEKLAANILQDKNYVAPDEPAYIPELPDNADLVAIDAEILSATETNNKAAAYNQWLQQKENLATLRTEAENADKAVTAIETERMNLIKTANMPEGFSFSDDGILYNGLAFTREQLSSSGLYIAALKLAAMQLGELKTLHFDASFLDKNSLAEIEKWSTSEGLQLLIERPDFEGGEIKYEIIHEQ